MAFMYGQSRIFFVMARDGLLPERLSAVNRSGTPVLMTLVTGVIVAAIAGFLSLQEIAELANAGTLVAFIAVAVCLLVLRNKAPTQPRPFSVPAPWLIAIGAIAGCAYLFVSLPLATIQRFLIWNVVGVAVYFLYARHRSVLGRAAPAAEPSP
jgi:APA family basic amino acid/polyamine antiporter